MFPQWKIKMHVHLPFQVAYSILNGNTNNTFEIINGNQVVLAKPLKEAPESRFNLRVGF